jgi:hypothetical protein
MIDSGYNQFCPVAMAAEILGSGGPWFSFASSSRGLLALMS